jgi:F0F1-type ATP synthase delta subunit
MSDEVAKTYADFALPPALVTRRDVSRLVDEVERIDNEMTAATVRAKTGAPSQESSGHSEQLDEFLQQNSLSLDNDHERTELVHQLRTLKDKVPIIHMTFAVEADRESLGQLVKWLRESVHPQAVIAVGLQPALVAGVYLRTPNHIHDLSLRAKLEGSRDVLVKELETYRG